MSESFDVVTFGETMLRLSPPNHQLLEQAQTVQLHVGGSESNVAIGLSRLGLRVAWISALPDNPLGHYVERQIAAQGVDTSEVFWATQGRLGLYWVEQGAAPRATQVLYDRSDTAISRMTPDLLPTELFQRNGAALLHLSGITPALSDSAAESTMRALKLAKQAGWQVSFDLNYRSKLWDTDSAYKGCLPFIEQADFVFAPQRDIQQVFGIAGSDSEDTLKQFHQRCVDSILIMTVGSEGAMARLPNGEIVHEPGYEAIAIDPIGAGDTFVAGFLSQVVLQRDVLNLRTALQWANACAALKYTIPGDMPLISRSAVIALINRTASQHITR